MFISVYILWVYIAHSNHLYRHKIRSTAKSKILNLFRRLNNQFEHDMLRLLITHHYCFGSEIIFSPENPGSGITMPP